MDRYLIIAIISSTLVTSVLCSPDLQQINSKHEELNPLNEDSNLTTKAQDKRTIFNPTIKNYAWAKHVAIRPSGAKYLLGYSPVDLKYRPVLRPLSINHQGYHYDRPKLRFQLKKPVIHIPQVRPVLQTEWKPVVKPAVPIHVPPPAHILTKPARPVLHVDEFKPAHADHLHLNPVPHLDHIHAQKVPSVHVDHVQQVQVPHVDVVHKFPQPTHLHQVPVAQVEHVHQVPVHQLVHVSASQVPQAPHVVPQAAQVVHQAQFVPSSQLFEVTKPNLGVLPLGAVFESPVLRDVPAPQFKPALVHQHYFQASPAQNFHQVIPQTSQLQPVHPVTHLHPVPSTQLRPVAVPQAIGQVEYHGVTNLQASGNGVHTLLPNHYHLQYPQIQQHNFQIERPDLFQQLPHQEHVQTVHSGSPGLFASNQNLPHDTQTYFQQLPHQEPGQAVHPGSTGLFPSQQHLPLDTQPHFQQLPHQEPVQIIHSGTTGLFPNQQQLPLNSQTHFQEAGRNVFQQQLPQTQAHFQIDQNNFQSEHDVQHVFPQDASQQQVPQGNFHQQLPQDNIHQQFPQISFHQQLPQENFQHQEPQNNFHQQLPQGNFQEVDDTQNEENSKPEVNSNSGHFQPADQVSSVHFYRPGQFQIGEQNDARGYFYRQPENVQGNSVQVGETDLQLPLHLPHHPGFDGTGRQFEEDESSGEDSQKNSDFRPSIQLEPPY